MTLDTLLIDLENYLIQSGTKVRALLITLIRESIFDFIQLHEWRRLQTAVTLNLNGENTYDLSLLLLDSFAIIDVVDAFTVSGNIAPVLRAGDSFTVSASTGNDGTYTISSVTYSGGITTIEVEETIPSTVADGTITFAKTHEPFYDGIRLFNSSGDELLRMGYTHYLKQPAKTGVWSILGDTLYTEATGELVLVYESIGEELTLQDLDAEPLPLKHYGEIIRKLTEIKYIAAAGEVQLLSVEEAAVSRMINATWAKENRIEKEGQFHHINPGG